MTATSYYRTINKDYVNMIRSQLYANNYWQPFMTTVRFKYVPLSSSSTGSQYRFFTNELWNLYYKIYRFILSQLHRNYGKKGYLHPRTYDFLDVDGSRENPCVAFTESTIPHVHSVYLVHAETLERFQSLAASGFKSVIEHESNRRFVTSIHAQPINADDLPRVVGYCSKFLDSYHARPIRHAYPLFNQFPVPECEKAGLKQDREALPFFAQVQSRRDMKRLRSPPV